MSRRGYVTLQASAITNLIKLPRLSVMVAGPVGAPTGTLTVAVNAALASGCTVPRSKDAPPALRRERTTAPSGSADGTAPGPVTTSLQGPAKYHLPYTVIECPRAMSPSDGHL